MTETGRGSTDALSRAEKLIDESKVSGYVDSAAQKDRSMKEAAAALSLESLNADPKTGKFPNARETANPGYSGPVFELSQNFPVKEPNAENYPWLKYDVKTQMKEYMQAVLDYVLEGNVEVGFAGQNNQVRQWYHAPWLHYGPKGREFTHGLTMERNSRPGELSNGQTGLYQNWGVGLYNPVGAYTLGQVWKDPNKPNVDNVRFPEGTVSFKLLFTEAPVSEVPYLKGAPEIEANVYKQAASPVPPDAPKEIRKLRLLQMDVAIKDSRSKETGWVLGTYVYNGNLNNENPWKNIQPVGAAWGNDPDVTRMKAYLGEKLQQQSLNDAPTLPPQHLGWAGRLNGPVDNPVSGCLSCHGRAQWPMKDVVPPKTVEYDSPEWMKFFTNVRSGEPESPGHKSLDYSLQLAEGIKNYYEWRKEFEKTRK